MHHPHRTALLIAAAAALSAVWGCGHRSGFEEYANEVFKAGGTTETDGGTSGPCEQVSGVCTTDPLVACVNDRNMVPGYEESSADATWVNGLLDSADVDTWITQMLGVDRTDNPNWQDIERSPDVEDFGGAGYIRGYRYRDAGKGVNLDAGQDNRGNDQHNYATAFPAPSLRAASWDMDLEWRVGQAMGDEVAATQNNMLLAPCMNIIRHPYWGRTQETYGEDSYHIGRMASAFTAGLQTVVVSCAKHFAANNVEKNRSNQDAIMTEQTLREIYGRHFEMVIQDGGVGCIMAAYNKINGTKCTQNRHLLTDILRDDMGYQGLVISDWWAMPGYQTVLDTAQAQIDAADAAIAGLDIEVPWTLHYGLLSSALNDGTSGLDSSYIRQAAFRVLMQKRRFRTTQRTDPWGLGTRATALGSDPSNLSSITRNDVPGGHLDLAEEAAVKSAVLLKNGPDGGQSPVLPLAGERVPPSIAVVGPNLQFALNESLPPTSSDGVLRLATQVSIGDRGSSRVNPDPDKSVGPFDGIQTVAGQLGLATVVTSGDTVDSAANADVVVVMVGLDPADEGEEYAIPAQGDRTTLDLSTDQNGYSQNQFVSDVLDLGKPTIIAIESGSIVNVPWLSHQNQNQATIWLGYAGQRGGLALGRLLFGDRNFSGKMPMAWPQQADLDAQLVFETNPGENLTEMGYFFGYRLYDHVAAGGTPVNLVFPFGWGMSYTTFSYSNLQIPCADTTQDGVVYATVDITNPGPVAGEEVAMLFVAGPPVPAGITGDRNVKELKSFAKVAVPAGEMVTATLPLRIRDLRHWEGGETGQWVIDPGDYTILVGPDAGAAGNVSDFPESGTLTVNP